MVPIENRPSYPVREFMMNKAMVSFPQGRDTIAPYTAKFLAWVPGRWCPLFSCSDGYARFIPMTALVNPKGAYVGIEG
jgi:hypothetical protein